MLKIVHFLFIVCIIGAIGGCGPRQLALGGESVHLSNESVPQSCQFLENITHSNVHGDMFLQASLKDLEKDDINFLKNEGAKLEANIVVLGTHEAIATQTQVPKHPLYYTIYRHRIYAHAYRCPPNVLDELTRNFENFTIKETPLI